MRSIIGGRREGGGEGGGKRKTGVLDTTSFAWNRYVVVSGKHDDYYGAGAWEIRRKAREGLAQCGMVIGLPGGQLKVYPGPPSGGGFRASRLDSPRKYPVGDCASTLDCDIRPVTDGSEAEVLANSVDAAPHSTTSAHCRNGSGRGRYIPFGG